MTGADLFSKLKKIEYNDRILLLTHTDADGAGAAIALKSAEISIDHGYHTIRYLNNGIMSEEIRNAVCSETADNYDIIIACDIYCSKKDADIIASSPNASKLVILDHHLTSKHLNDYPFGVSQSEMVEDSFRAPLFKNTSNRGLSSGASLMYDYLHYCGLVDINRCDDYEFDNSDIVLRKIIHLIATYDTWDWVNCFNSNTIYLDFNRLFESYGIDYFVSEMYTRAWRCRRDNADELNGYTHHKPDTITELNLENVFDDDDETILSITKWKEEHHLAQIQNSIRTGTLELDNREYTVAYIDNNKFTAAVFERMKKLYPDVDLYIVNYGTGVSVRSIKPEINVSEITKRCNGGGHAGAGGFKIPMEYIIDAFNKTINGSITFDKKE